MTIGDLFAFYWNLPWWVLPISIFITLIIMERRNG